MYVYIHVYIPVKLTSQTVGHTHIVQRLCWNVGQSREEGREGGPRCNGLFEKTNILQCMCVHVRMCVHVTCVCTCVYVRVCTCTMYIHVRMCVCTCVRVIYMCVCVRTCKYTCATNKLHHQWEQWVWLVVEAPPPHPVGSHFQSSSHGVGPGPETHSPFPVYTCGWKYKP